MQLASQRMCACEDCMPGYFHMPALSGAAYLPSLPLPTLRASHQTSCLCAVSFRAFGHSDEGRLQPVIPHSSCVMPARWSPGRFWLLPRLAWPRSGAALGARRPSGAPASACGGGSPCRRASGRPTTPCSATPRVFRAAADALQSSGQRRKALPLLTR